MKLPVFIKLTQNAAPTLINVSNVVCICPNGPLTRVHFNDDAMNVDQDFNIVQALIVGSGYDVYEPPQPKAKDEPAVKPIK